MGRYAVPDALRAVGAKVEVHADHFAQDAVDELWLREAGPRGWVVLTKKEQLHVA